MPLAIVVGFVLAAVVTGTLDRNDLTWLRPVAEALSTMAPPQANQGMLRTVAPGMLTLMTITFLLLLTLVQSMSGVLTWVVVEQFLSRRTNQSFFGYFAGLSTYLVIVLAVVNPGHSVFSTIAALVFSVLAMVGLVVFGYLVLDQLRPPSVVERIVQLTVAYRAEQLTWLRRVRSEPLLARLPATTVCAEVSGYLVDIDLDALARAAASARGAVEIEFRAFLGSHVVVGSDIAAVRGEDAVDRERMADAVLDALRCGRERQLDREPRYGVHELSSMGWAAATQSDPESAMVTVDGLHTLLAHWAREPATASGPDSEGDRLPIVYRDSTISEVLSALANIAVGAVEGGQHQTGAHVLNVFATALPRLSELHQREATVHLRHALKTVTRQPFTADLERALAGLGRALSDTGHPDIAAELRHAESRLDEQVSTS